MAPTQRIWDAESGDGWGRGKNNSLGWVEALGRDLPGISLLLDAALSASSGWENIPVLRQKTRIAEGFLLLFLFYCSG